MGAAADRDGRRVAIESSTITGQSPRDPNGVIVPRSYPVAARAISASGMDSRFTPRRVRSLGQEISRSPGTSTSRKSSSARRTTRVLMIAPGSTPRAVAASARLPTRPCRVTECSTAVASSAAAAAASPGPGVLIAVQRRRLSA